MRSVAAALIATALLMPGAAAADELSFCYDPYPPYTLGSEGAPTGGLKVKLLEAVVARIDGVTARVELLPWKRCQQDVKAGMYDGILPLFPNDERRTYMAFSDPTIHQDSVFWYSRAHHPQGLSWDGDATTLSHLTLGMLRGSYIDSAVEDTFSVVQRLERADSVAALFLMLEHGRIDLVAIDAAVGRYTVKHQDTHDAFEQVERPISTRASAFGLSRVTGADRHIEAFNTAIAALRQSGALQAIQNDTP